MKTVKIFAGVNINYQHDGLFYYAKKNDVDITSLAPGETVLFVNEACTRIKAYGSNGVVAYLRGAQTAPSRSARLTVRDVDALVSSVNPGERMVFSDDALDALVKLLEEPTFRKPTKKELASIENLPIGSRSELNPGARTFLRKIERSKNRR